LKVPEHVCLAFPFLPISIASVIPLRPSRLIHEKPETKAKRTTVCFRRLDRECNPLPPLVQHGSVDGMYDEELPKLMTKKRREGGIRRYKNVGDVLKHHPVHATWP
jgi:hypothetical protein